MQKYQGGSSGYLSGDPRAGTKITGKNTRVRGQIRDGDRAPSVDVQGLGPHSDPTTPFYSVGAPSRGEVEDALDRESVPAGSRPLVQGYFDAIRGRR
jgi:hypothetical protein